MKGAFNDVMRFYAFVHLKNGGRALSFTPVHPFVLKHVSGP